MLSTKVSVGIAPSFDQSTVTMPKNNAVTGSAENTGPPPHPARSQAAPVPSSGTRVICRRGSEEEPRESQDEDPYKEKGF